MLPKAGRRLNGLGRSQLRTRCKKLKQRTNYFTNGLVMPTDEFWERMDGFYGQTNFAESHMFEYKQFSILSGSDRNGSVERRAG